MSGQIFISYRREESRWSARSLHDRLIQRFDRNQIFMDVDSVGLGEDFVKTIEETVGSCDVLIAVIGAHWLTSTEAAIEVFVSVLSLDKVPFPGSSLSITRRK
jgi:hypothetical protein